MLLLALNVGADARQRRELVADDEGSSGVGAVQLLPKVDAFEGRNAVEVRPQHGALHAEVRLREPAHIGARRPAELGVMGARVDLEAGSFVRVQVVAADVERQSIQRDVPASFNRSLSDRSLAYC